MVEESREDGTVSKEEGHGELDIGGKKRKERDSTDEEGGGVEE